MTQLPTNLAIVQYFLGGWHIHSPRGAPKYAFAVSEAEDPSGGRGRGAEQLESERELLLELLGRRDWTRTNDPHHVKVVL